MILKIVLNIFVAVLERLMVSMYLSKIILL